MKRAASALAALALAFGACHSAKHVGKYTNRANPAETLELRADGSFDLAGESGRSAGAYQVEEDTITLAGVAAPVGHAALRATLLVDAGGGVWARNFPAGHYAHRSRPEFLCDLRPDGSYHYAKGATDHRGRYEVDKGVVTLSYPSDGRCTRGGAGPAVPSPGSCAFLAEAKGESLTFFKLTGEPGHEQRELGEEFILQPVR
jgi:hypothetical protein